jgi:hypothetical protein
MGQLASPAPAILAQLVFTQKPEGLIFYQPVLKLAREDFVSVADVQYKALCILCSAGLPECLRVSEDFSYRADGAPDLTREEVQRVQCKKSAIRPHT